ncbi:MAG: Rid family detoxifying hydrolase [Gammaproteobacteria bacterium]|nr:Rid family detoxifying hydrolase [Gammaproteobacteria bacterium]
MAAKEVKTTNAPQAIGPYSQAINHNGLCFLSGQIPLDTSGNLVKGGLRDQAEQVFKNIEAILIEQDATLKNIVKLNVYLIDINNFDVINGLMAELFETPYPARALVEVSALPKNSSIEIEAVAHIPL